MNTNDSPGLKIVTVFDVRHLHVHVPHVMCIQTAYLAGFPQLLENLEK